MKKSLLALAFSFGTGFSQAETKESTIGHVKEITTYLETHSRVSARGMIDFNLDVDLASPCSRVYLDKDEQTVVSMLLSAKAKDVKLRVYYYTDVVSPWNKNTCQIYALREY